MRTVDSKLSWEFQQWSNLTVVTMKRVKSAQHRKHGCIYVHFPHLYRALEGYFK